MEAKYAAIQAFASILLQIKRGKEVAYFSAAQAISKLSDHTTQVGCVIVHGHRIISSGCNSVSRHHRLQARIDRKHFGNDLSQGAVHAEIDALIPLIRKKRDLSCAAVYVFRQRHDGSLAMARPCARCLEVIQKYGIKRICYTTDDGFAIEKLV